MNSLNIAFFEFEMILSQQRKGCTKGNPTYNGTPQDMKAFLVLSP